LKVDNQQRLDEWQHVALVLDRIFFILFTIAMPCTGLLFVSAHLSIENDFRSNLTNIKIQSIDAKCDLLYKPILT
jgi:cytochrome b561